MALSSPRRRPRSAPALALLRLLAAAAVLLDCNLSPYLAHAATFADLPAAARGRPIAVVNARPFHSEVLSGAMAALAPVADQVAVYMDQYVFKGKDGFRQLVWSYPGLLLRTPQRAAGEGAVPRHRLVFFLSPEASLGYTRWFINASRPTVVVHMIHNADDVEAVKQLLDMTAGSGSSSSSSSISDSSSSNSGSGRSGGGTEGSGVVVTKLVALSPHVVEALRSRGFQADWWLAAWPPAAATAETVQTAGAAAAGAGARAGGQAGGSTGRSKGGSGAGADDIHACPAFRNGSVPAAPWGFACQGRQDSRRRSYDTLWRELEAAVAAATSSAGAAASANGGGAGQAAAAAPPPPPPRLKVLGRSVGPQSGAGVPKAVRPLVSRITNAPYALFYRHIACSTGLLPLFADDSYLSTKFSSTVLASLTTGTPILADERMLRAYSFLQPAQQHVWLRAPGEGLVAAMQRLAAEPPAEAEARRAGLAALRARLNRRAAGYLISLLGASGGAGGGDDGSGGSVGGRGVSVVSGHALRQTPSGGWHHGSSSGRRSGCGVAVVVTAWRERTYGRGTGGSGGTEGFGPGGSSSSSMSAEEMGRMMHMQQQVFELKQRLVESEVKRQAAEKATDTARSEAVRLRRRLMQTRWVLAAAVALLLATAGVLLWAELEAPPLGTMALPQGGVLGVLREWAAAAWGRVAGTWAVVVAASRAALDAVLAAVAGATGAAGADGARGVEPR
ncbi:hypothetical protein HYH02_005538 [Chlamydomonas schloesseri]|uniref:Uncharacterized protein n=1 Tax=Chlamydomonas schloesseri TaxID=2026947 RepID=A0A835WLD1_9CHLO|nr:hypothetical protein HYH02_005538 [Chlamydomonas schloesseri]|eukprot:KAG2449388.1 hypothetical protein HYH02_005538 [Chlamydomonas schloesseri]